MQLLATFLADALERFATTIAGPFERLPTYSPELNVVELYWNHVKNTCMANFAAKKQKQVIEQVELATATINADKNLLPAFLKHCKLKR